MNTVLDKIDRAERWRDHLRKRCAHTSSHPAPRRLFVHEIKRAVADHYGLGDGILEGDSRQRGIARARQIAMYLARTMTTASTVQIGRWFGSRDHTTVIHAIRTIEDMEQRDPDIEQALRTIRQTLAWDTRR